MRCVILAAGRGTRLRSASASKPLTPVWGTPLIEQVMRRARAAGASSFLVVTGYRGAQVEAQLARLASTVSRPVRWIRASGWRKANGHSLLAAAAQIEGSFLLLMADHLFDPAVARRLIEADRGGGIVLAVDRDLASPLLDLDDATKVALGPDGAIRQIGKALDRFDAIDTGLFLAGPELAEAIRADVAAGGEGSLSAGVQRLADIGAARTLDATGAHWIDIDDPRSLALAEASFRPIRGSEA